MGFKSLKPEAKIQVSRFSLTVGTSGNTTYILSRTYPAGNYTIEFSNGDTTYDIYAIGTDGTNVGYTNGATLTSNAPINEIVVLGAADNEVITFQNSSFTILDSGVPIAPSSVGDVASAGAFITSVSVSSLPNANDTTTITGGNFAADVQVFFTGQDSVELEAKSLTRNSSTELVATRPDALDADDSPYTVKVVNPGVAEPAGSSAHLLANSVTAGANPSWVTAAAQEYNPTAAVSITLTATDADGTVSYSLQSGTLPGGLSLNGSTGVISGTPTTSDGDVNIFTIRATDEGANFVDREFTFTAALPAVEYLVIAGGGSGGYGHGGGGGAGGYRSNVNGELSGRNSSAENSLKFGSNVFLNNNYTVTIGAGGAPSTSGGDYNVGSNSAFYTVTSTGGGGGGTYTESNSLPNGGSGGGGAGGTGAAIAAPGLSRQGFGGGNGADMAQPASGGGGGGAGQTGEAAASSTGGDGGDGIQSFITGSAIFRAGGGGGGGYQGTAGIGGEGGGADGVAASGGVSGDNGIANTGGGGGGGSGDGGSGGSGGSGIVILRYPSAYSITIGAGLTGTENTDGDFKYAEITSGTGNVSWSAS